MANWHFVSLNVSVLFHDSRHVNMMLQFICRSITSPTDFTFIFDHATISFLYAFLVYMLINRTFSWLNVGFYEIGFLLQLVSAGFLGSQWRFSHDRKQNLQCNSSCPEVDLKLAKWYKPTCFFWLQMQPISL